MSVMPRAVLFDLFGTLTGAEGRRGGYNAELATLLDVPNELLSAQLRETYDERARGVLGDIRHQLVTLASRLGAVPSAAALEAAVALRLRAQSAALEPRANAIEVLTALRARGVRLGVLSDCTCEIPLLWPQTPYASLVDAALFSCDLGFRKPDPRAYAALLERLGVEAPGAIYVGDGGSHELTGARRAGMRPVLLKVEGEGHFRPDEEDAWIGEVIGDLAEVLDLVVEEAPDLRRS